MSYNVLGARRTRHYARLLGIPIDRIITRGSSGHLFQFRTVYHEHGLFRWGTEVEDWVVRYWRPFEEYHHWATCRERFPEDFEGYPPYRYIGPRGSDWLRNGV